MLAWRPARAARIGRQSAHGDDDFESGPRARRRPVPRPDEPGAHRVERSFRAPAPGAGPR